MSKVTLYCEDAQGLKLGPGTGYAQVPGQLIVFFKGYASFEESDFPDWRAWAAKGAPHIEQLEGDEVPSTFAAFVCPTCEKGFASQKGLNGHRLSHRPKA